MRSAEVWRTERAWFTKGRDGLDAAWVALVLDASYHLRTPITIALSQFEITLPAG